MKNMLNKIGKSKFLFIGLVIGLISSMGVRMIMNPSNNGVPVWMFIFTPIIAFIFLKFWRKNKL